MPKLKRILTISDLVTYCQSNNFASFSSKDKGYQLAVQIPATYEVDEYDSRRGLMRLKIKVFHTGLNRNGSFVSEESAIKAMSSIKNRPLLANIHKLDDGSWDFGSHDIKVITNEDGEEEYEYIESQIGSFTEDEPWLEDDGDKKFVMAYAVVPEDYTKAADIIREKQGSKNSCELIIDELVYNGKDKYLELLDFYVNASTLLGKKDDGTEIGEGMLGSRADIVDFSAEHNSTLPAKFEQQLVEMQSKLDELISRFNINENKGKEETTTLKFEELLKKYNKTKEDITFEYESLSDEELEAKFAEMFEETPEDTGAEGGEDNSTGEEPIESNTENSNTVPDNDPENNTGNFEKKTFRTVDENGKMTISYEISHEDTKYALYNLLAPYEDSNNEWYFIIGVYNTYFAYENWEGSKIYGQKYTVDGDNVAFDGERYSLHRELLTDSEYAELKTMRENYASLVQFKSDTENAQLHSQREDILSNKTYAVLAEKETDSEGNETYKNKAYAKLVAEMDNYSPADLEKELKSVFADYITNGGQFSYSGEEKKPQVSKKQYASLPTKSKSGRYGNLFKEKEK